MAKFRISIGSASCRDYEKRTGSEREACERVLAQIEALKELSFQQLVGLPEEKTERQEVNGQKVLLTTFKRVVSDDEVLIVVQAFTPTWIFPTFFSGSGIGKLFVEGIVVRTGETPRAALDNELWAYK